MLYTACDAEASQPLRLRDHAAVEVIGKRWSLLVLRDVMFGGPADTSASCRNAPQSCPGQFPVAADSTSVDYVIERYPLGNC